MTSSWSEAGAWIVPSTQVHLLEHETRRWRITVAETAQPRDTDAPRPVLYLLDPFGTLGIGVHIVRTLHLLSDGAFPPLTVVGVGPDTDDIAELSRLRALDLTTCAPSGEPTPGYGSAAPFLALLTDVVMPHVEAVHRVSPEDRTIAGWSLGALFGVHALLEQPSAFRRYLLVSPSLYWGDHEILRRVAPPLLRCTDPTDVYLACGELEQGDAARTWPTTQSTTQADIDSARMVDNTRRLADLFADLPNVSVTIDILPGEHHTTVWPSALTRGLLTLHGAGYHPEP